MRFEHIILAVQVDWQHWKRTVEHDIYLVALNQLFGAIAFSNKPFGTGFPWSRCHFKFYTNNTNNLAAFQLMFDNWQTAMNYGKRKIISRHHNFTAHTFIYTHIHTHIPQLWQVGDNKSLAIFVGPVLSQCIN